jgi:hypothetical protein
MPKVPKKIKDVVILIAFDTAENVVEEVNMTYDQYYEDLHSLIDDELYRKNKGIRKLQGKIYNYKGVLEQSFENIYSESGKKMHGCTIHADGTVIKN